MEELNKDGSSYLHQLVEYDYESPQSFSYYMKAIKQLDRVCNINAQDSSGKTPLRVAAEERNDNAVKALLACGADVDVEAADGEVALQPAGYDSCRLLLEHYEKMEVAKVYTKTKVRDISFSSSRVLNLKRDNRNKLMIYRLEHKRMRLEKLPGYPDSLADLLSTSASSIELGKLQALKKLFESNYLDTEFSELGCLLRMQYRRAMAVLKVDRNDAEDSLVSVLGIKLPYLCVRCILDYLDECDLINLVTVRSQLQEEKEEEEEVEDKSPSKFTSMSMSKTCQII